MTDDKGYYAIEAINYSKSEEFVAKPAVSFYLNNAVEFNKAYTAYVELTEFDLPDTFAVQVIVKPYDLIGEQSILSNDNTDFDLYVEGGMYKLSMFGETQDLGPASKSYQNISLNVVEGTVEYYLDGNLINTLSYGTSSYDFSGAKWNVGRRENGTSYFTGLVDEVAFFNDILTPQEIQLHASPVDDAGVSVGNSKLAHFFTFNEGDGIEALNEASTSGEFGTLFGTSFSIITFRQIEQPHLFRPSDRLVIINTSNTAASGIDFVDESTVTISGIVRFENTVCYQDSVEILVDGKSATPPIFTDSVGYFVGDFEPGASVKLSPKYGEGEEEKHVFTPGFFEARRINRPLITRFLNQTKRTIRGQLSGGDDRLSVINQGEIVRMKVKAENQCYEEELTLEDLSGHFVFEELPAVKFATVMTYHDDPTIYNFMQEQGGQSSDMRLIEKDTLDFRYFSDPFVWIQPFDPGVCPNGGQLQYPYIDESGPSNSYKSFKKTLRMYEDYPGGRQWLKDFDLVITNNLNDEGPHNVSIPDSNAYEYEFLAGQANIAGDFSKFLEVKGTSKRGNTHVATERAIVLGERARESSFVTKAPAYPLLILRDPPGDGSSATWEAGETNCTTWGDFTVRNEDADSEVSLKLGAKIETSVGIGATLTKELEVVNDRTITGSFSTSTDNQSEGTLCVTTTKTITTSDSDDVPGSEAGGDVYVGAAVNFKFSANDVLYLDYDVCQIKQDSQTISVEPVGFETEYVYSEWQIRGTVIPNLILTNDTLQAQEWENILDINARTKQVQVDKNITFDGLTTYTESKESSGGSSTSIDFATEVSVGLETEIGFEIDKKGGGFKISSTVGKVETDSEGSSKDTSILVSYTLADDDPNDSYSIDVGDDKVFGTPVFKVQAGESMCPWIPGTLNREEVGLQFDRLTAVNIPANEAATYRLKISNLGQTGRDPLVYIIGIKQGSNPDGAIVTMDGESLINPIPIQLQPQETKEFLISIEKGPDVNVFTYNKVGIFAASECQYDHALGLGYNLAGYADWEDNHNGEEKPVEGDEIYEGIYNVVDLEKFYKQFFLNVEFIEPCSEVRVGFPLENWVQTPEMGDNMVINLNTYNISDPELELLRVQYRQTGGDGAWINITEIPKDSITNPVFTNITWDMSQLADAEYEVRALAQCNSGLNPGISKVVQGRKETRPPIVFGAPQPADGVLQPGDEISITFSKRINCNKIFPADGIGTNISLNNMALQDMTLGGVLIDAEYICKDDKIVVVPRIPKRFMENHTLRVTATGIEDLYGNIAETEVWEFYVNQSNLYWAGGDVEGVTLEGHELMVTRQIRNQSGENTSFNIPDYPDWMQIFPTEGSLEPGQILTVNFIFPDDLVNGEYNTTIQMETIDGDEPLDVSLRVVCPEPEWQVDPAQFTFSMNVTAKVDIEGTITEDRLDILGAFVNGALRGTAKIEYVRALDEYMAFLTIYSNVASGETVTFKVWDASDCLLFGSTLETYPFIPDDLKGSPLTPEILHTDGEVERKIYIHPGWNWLSYNIDLTDPSTNDALSLLTNPAGGFIKSQTQFSTYSSTTNSWVGNLTDLSHLTMYQLNSVLSDSLVLLGAPIDVSTPISLTAGWNWLGYLPQYGLPITRALSSLTPLNGDIIKGQSSFAQYVAGLGWVGNLSYLSAPNGYLIKLTEMDELIYPPQVDVSGFDGSGGIFVEGRNRILDNPEVTDLGLKPQLRLRASNWEIDPQNFEHSMNTIAVVIDRDSENTLSEGDQVGAFYQGEIRGVGSVVYVEELDQSLLFMTIYSNTEEDKLTFKYFDNVSGEEMDIRETLPFNINEVLGAVENPFEFTLNSITSVNDLGQDEILKVYPNPAVDDVNIRFYSNKVQDIEISIHDLAGKEVKSMTRTVLTGQNDLIWTPAESMEGVFYLDLRDENTTYSRKIVVLRK